MGRALAGRVLSHLAASESRPEGSGAIDLTAAEPATTPEHVRAAAKTALDQGETHYTAGTGIPELREAIAGRLTAGGYPVEQASVGVTNGGTEAIYIALQSALKPGDTALIVEPISPHIVDMVEFIGATPLRITTSQEDNFTPTVDDIRDQDAQLLLIASPSAVTGKRIPTIALEELITAARERQMPVLLDLSYADGLYIPEVIPFSNPDLTREIILTGSFSTAFGLAGWRIGFFSAPPADLALFNGLKMSMSICTTAVSQFAATTALTGPFDWFVDRREEFAARRDLATALLDDAGFDYVRPDAFPPLLIDVSGMGGGDAVADELAGQNVAVDPGSRFGPATAGYVRINLGASEASLRSGIERMTKLGGSSR
jgi:aspartate/methionine/tyrosine aminotransferase